MLYMTTSHGICGVLKSVGIPQIHPALLPRRAKIIISIAEKVTPWVQKWGLENE
jgi:hypothetical protein